MKIRISLGLDLDALPLETHEHYLRQAVVDMQGFRSLHVDLKIVNATAVLEVTSDRPKLPSFQNLLGDLNTLDVYRWVNISKET